MRARQVIHQGGIAATDFKPCPEIDLDLLKWLEAAYPPRCYEGNPGESLEQHLKYAGAVGLISYLRNERDMQGQNLMEDALAANLTRDIPRFPE